MMTGRTLALVVSMAFLASCGAAPEGDVAARTEGISLSLAFPPEYIVDRATGEMTGLPCPACAAAPSYVTSVTLTITGGSLSSPQVYGVPLDTGVVEGILPPGVYTFSVTVNTATGLTFTGSTTVMLATGPNPTITINLEINAPPVIESLTLSNPSPLVNESVTVTAVVTDPDSDDVIIHSWSASGGTLSGSGASVTFTVTQPGAYSVTLTAFDGRGGVAIQSVGGSARSEIPTGVTASAGDGSVTVAWDPVTGASSYNIYWSTTSGAGTGGTKIANAVAPFLHDPLANGTTYYYMVTAVINGIESAPSAQVSATPQSGLPVAPTGVTAASSDTTVTISWNAVAGATSYNLYWDTAPGVTTASDQIANITSPYDHMGLANGTTFYYAVTAMNGNGESALSSEVSATPGILLAGLFTDANLQVCVDAAFPAATYTSEVAGTLNCANKNIVSLTGMEYLTGVSQLTLNTNQIVDVSPLSGLTGLTTLYLGSNQIVDVSPLSGLTNLTYLYLFNNQIVNVSPLAGLTGLPTLFLHYNQIVDVSPLAGLTSLTTLDLRTNLIVDVAPLSGLTGLTTLYLSTNQIVDVAPLAALTGLTTLYLDINQIVDVSPLAGMTGMTWMNLGNNQIVDVSALAGMTGMTQVWLYNNQIVDVAPLAGLTNLIDLHLYNNQIGGQGVGNVDSLVTLVNVTSLSLDNNIGMSCGELTTLITALGAPPVSPNPPTPGTNCTNP